MSASFATNTFDVANQVLTGFSRGKSSYQVTADNTVAYRVVPVIIRGKYAAPKYAINAVISGTEYADKISVINSD